MSHVFRFFGSKDAQNHWQLCEIDLRRIIQVLRFKQGDEFEITDGVGTLATAIVMQPTNKRGSTLAFEIMSETTSSPSDLEWNISIGALKPKTAYEIIPFLVELGASNIRFFLTQGVEKQRLSSEVKERCQRIAIESAKIAKRYYFPNLHFHDSLSQTISESHEVNAKLVEHHEVLKFLATPHGPETLLSKLESLKVGQKSVIEIVIGSEQGLTDKEEADFVQNDYSPVNLGSHTLRSFTACLTAGAVLSMSCTQH